MKTLFTLLILLSTPLVAKEQFVLGVIPIDKSSKPTGVELSPKESKALIQLAAKFTLEKLQHECPTPKYYFGGELDMGSMHELEMRVAISSLDELPKPIYEAIFGADAKPQGTEKQEIKPLKPEELGVLEIKLKKRLPNEHRPKKSEKEFKGKDIIKKGDSGKSIVQQLGSYMDACTLKEFKSNDDLADQNVIIDTQFKNKNGRLEFTFTEKEMQQTPSFIKFLFTSLLDPS